MRSLFIGSLALGLLSASVVVGCGDSGTTGSGGGNAGGGGTGGNTTNSGGGGTGGQSACTEISADVAYLGADFGNNQYYGGDVTPALGGADADPLQLILAPDATGTLDLAADADPTTCSTCIFVSQDDPGDGETPPAKLFFQASGTVDLGTTSPIYVSGTISNVKLVEVNQDDGTIVPGGACLTITSLPIAVVPPTPGWTCDPSYYEDGEYCDCECGAVDPDCSDTALEISGCYEGQTCDATAACVGTPTAWTCAGDQFDGGVGNGCDCNCGLPDPDCDIASEALEGCSTGDVCNINGACVGTAWACDPDYVNDGACDCGCGAPDSDCDDATNASCEYCADDGSCDTVECDDPASKINATNNATCD